MQRVIAADHDEIGLPKAHPDRFAAICNPVAALLAMLVAAPVLSLAQGGPPPGKGPGAMRLFDGPDFWVDKQTVKLAKGDEVTVKGSKITFEGKPAIIAVTVTRGATTLVLRDEKGAPVWKGQGMGQGGK